MLENKKFNEKKNNALFIGTIIAITFLFIFAVVQTIQVKALSAEIRQGNSQNSAQSANTDVSSANQVTSAPRAPTQQQQPAMVGGC